MAEELTGNVLVAQSGGPTAVINASLAGVIEEALNHGCIEEIYGGLNGVLGILQENLIDLAEESQQAIRGLRFTPASALGTCRFKLKKEADFQRVVEATRVDVEALGRVGPDSLPLARRGISPLEDD